MIVAVIHRFEVFQNRVITKYIWYFVFPIAFMNSSNYFPTYWPRVGPIKPIAPFGSRYLMDVLLDLSLLVKVQNIHKRSDDLPTCS